MDKNVDDVSPTSSASQEDNEPVSCGSPVGTSDVQSQTQASSQAASCVDDTEQSREPQKAKTYLGDRQVVPSPDADSRWMFPPPVKMTPPPEPSLIDSVPQEVTVASGLANAFLARHSQDQSLHESLFQVKLLSEETPSQGASYMDGTKDSGEPNKAKPYLGDCQVVPRPDVDSRWMLPCPVPGGEYDSYNAVGGSNYNTRLNTQLSGHVGPVPSYLTGATSNFPSSGALDLSNDNLFRSDFVLGAREPYLPLYGQVDSGLDMSVPRNQRLHSGMTVSHFANGSLMGTVGPQLTPPVHGLQRYSRRSNGASTLSAITGNSTYMLNRYFGADSVESTDNSLLALEQRVEEACALVERVLREREERDQFRREIERKVREIKEWRARKKREREAREQEEASRWPQQQEAITGRSQWLCEHFQRHCRVRFPCCSYFHSCHRCHNNSKVCDKKEAKACHATHLKCSFCKREQEINEESQICSRCGTRLSEYFCFKCKHFTGEDKKPFHCDKCGICRIYRDRSFHCDVCNVCLDKGLKEKHKCRPVSQQDKRHNCLQENQGQEGDPLLQTKRIVDTVPGDGHGLDGNNESSTESESMCNEEDLSASASDDTCRHLNTGVATNVSPEPSLVDEVHVQGIDAVFLERHSQDPDLCASLQANDENTSLLEARPNMVSSLEDTVFRQGIENSCLVPSENDCVGCENDGSQACGVYGTIMPARCRPDSGHDVCCECLQVVFSGSAILPCSHHVHMECIVGLILNGQLNCPICGLPFLRRG